jgi:hypothetical protein
MNAIKQFINAGIIIAIVYKWGDHYLEKLNVFPKVTDMSESMFLTIYAALTMC